VGAVYDKDVNLWLEPARYLSQQLPPRN